MCFFLLIVDCYSSVWISFLLCVASCFRVCVNVCLLFIRGSAIEGRRDATTSHRPGRATTRTTTTTNSTTTPHPHSEPNTHSCRTQKIPFPKSTNTPTCLTDLMIVTPTVNRHTHVIQKYIIIINEKVTFLLTFLLLKTKSIIK